jgi:hypothetical protein
MPTFPGPRSVVNQYQLMAGRAVFLPLLGHERHIANLAPAIAGELLKVL